MEALVSKGNHRFSNWGLYICRVHFSLPLNESAGSRSNMLLWEVVISSYSFRGLGAWNTWGRLPRQVHTLTCNWNKPLIDKSYAAKSKFIDCPCFLPLSALPFMYACTGWLWSRDPNFSIQTRLYRMVTGDITDDHNNSILYAEVLWPIMAWYYISTA